MSQEAEPTSAAMASVCRVYDNTGRLIAVIDPITRIRQEITTPAKKRITGRANATVASILAAVDLWPHLLSFSPLDIARNAGTSAETVRRYFHIMKKLNYIRRLKGAGYKRRRWIKTGRVMATPDLVVTMLDVARSSRLAGK